MDSPFNNFFQKSVNLKHYVSDTIEVGYSHFGPTLAISGTLTAMSRVVLINNVSLLATRKKDDARHHFEWLAFRPHRFTLDGYKMIDLTMPTKFMVAESAPYPYNILFCDPAQQAAMRPVLSKVKESWIHAVSIAPLNYATGNQRALFEAFKQKEEYRAAVREFQENSYWEEGAYSVDIIIVPEKAKKLIEIQKAFTLTKENIVHLEYNTFTIIAGICNQLDVKYTCVYPKLT